MARVSAAVLVLIASLSTFGSSAATGNRLQELAGRPAEVVIPWEELSDEYAVGKRAVTNSISMRLVKDDPVFGTGYLLESSTGKPMTMLPGPSSPFATKTQMTLVNGVLTETGPDRQFYGLLGVGSSVELPDESVALFGILVRNGRIVIEQTGIRLVGVELSQE